MACPIGTISYTIQSGDTLYKIAAKYNTTYQAILTVNPGLNPNRLYIGQQIYIPVAQATLQIANQPILVNGTNINTGQYPVLNYKPPNAQYPYIYVPIAEFSKVGANVSWDEANQLLTVTTDYYTLQNTVYQQQSQIKDLQEQVALCNKTLVKFEGTVEGYYKFSGVYWSQQSPNNYFTIGKYYEVISQEPGMQREYMAVLNDNNQEAVFVRFTLAQPKGIVYIGIAEDDLYNFSWEGANLEKFKLLAPTSGEISLTPGRVYIAEKNWGYPGYEGKAYTIVGTDVVITPAAQ
ncbi:LysM peptidoglycan-binding domain-containing protein [Acetivibrio cellulolyticus]|uniref:LysM peptidoglycan-binding domain-containing protein n=1 Tax=Acetivibrio cellulolyticus TaxID=35830 RepID=UPI0001E2BE1D|nr:LysM domain-containing protein [Acetivibrio cellulolyticus]